jgi:hypothetical protein
LAYFKASSIFPIPTWLWVTVERMVSISFPWVFYTDSIVLTSLPIRAISLSIPYNNSTAFSQGFYLQ